VFRGKTSIFYDIIYSQANSKTKTLRAKMSDQDNYVKILEKISEIAVDTGILKNEMNHIKTAQAETRDHIERINKQDIEQNKLLDEHILGVRTAMERLELEKESRKQDKALIQKQMQEIDQRLKRAEVIPNAISKTGKFLVKIRRLVKWIAGFASALIILWQLFKQH